MQKNNKNVYVVLTLFVIFIVLISVTTYFSNYYLSMYTDEIQANIEERLFVECKVISTIVPKELLKEFVVLEDMEKPIYKEKILELEKYAKENNLMFAYFVRLVDGKVQYIIDSDPNPETHYGLEHFEESYELVVKAFEGKPAYNKIGEYLEGWEGILSAYVPIFDDDGTVIAVVGVDISDEDIVERKSISKNFRYLYISEVIGLVVISSVVILLYRKKAGQYNNASIAKSQFLSRMSHEIRTPMNAIMGFSRMTKNTDDGLKRKEYIQNIGDSSEFLLHLINNILDISKIEAGKMMLNIEKASTTKIIKNIQDMLNPKAKTKNQKFSINIGKNIPEYVYCDKTYLTQIIMNLLINSFKFTSENGEISMAITLLEEKYNKCNLQFVIKDNGIGIDEQYLSKIFEPFEQGDGGITRKYGGTGLGLATSKLFIEMMNGKIDVLSKVEEGTTFTFNVWLDIVPKGEEPEEKEEIVKATIDCKGKNFLLVEDNEINQTIAENVLKDFGANVEFANNGKEGLEKFLAGPDKYDIIFMDIQMPIMDGFEATKEIRKSNVKNAKEIPIIAMTAEVYKEEIDRALEARNECTCRQTIKNRRNNISNK